MLVIRCFVLETATRLHGKREVGDHINVDQHDYIFALPCEDVNFSTHAYRPVLQGYKNIYLFVTLDSSQGLVLATFQFEIIFHSFVSLPFSVCVCQSVCLCLSAKGTGRLACNIKYADRPRQRPALLKTPGPVQPGQFQTRQQGANAWQSVSRRLPSMTTPPSQQPGYTNVQRQPYCLMASSCPPHHHLPADNGYPPPPYYPYSIPPRRRVDTQSPDDVFEPRLDGHRSTAQPICHPISAFQRQHITHMYAAETLV